MPKQKKAPAKKTPLKSKAIDTFMNIDGTPTGQPSKGKTEGGKK